MDEESLQTALLSSKGKEEPAFETVQVPREKSEMQDDSARSHLSPPSKLSRLFHAFSKMFTPYFRETREGKALFLLLFIVILISCGGKVFLSYQINYFYTALEEKDVKKFTHTIMVFTIAMICFVIVDSFYAYIQVKLGISWRKWLTERVLKLYFHNKVYYSLERKSLGSKKESIDYYDAAVNKKAKVVDNPDQRIQEDVDSFTSYSLSLFSIIVESTVDMISFSVILASIMPMLFVGLVAFAFFGSLFTVLIGKKLVKLNFENLQREADFRFSLVRIRENAESIAFYSGEGVEEKETDRRLLRVIDNSTLINIATFRLNLFTKSYTHLTWILPIILIAPDYFADVITLGVVQQARGAFESILMDLSIIITEFRSIAQFSAGIERLFSFLRVMQVLDDDRGAGKDALLQDPSQYEKPSDDTVLSESAASTELSSSQSLSTITVKDVDLSESATLRSDPIISVTNLKLLTPDNKRVLVQDLDLSLQEDKNLLIVGVSGAGKSSLLRAIAGLWTTGDGLITRPSIKNICFLPQRPYCPPGTLRDNLVYPSMALEGGEFVDTKQWSDEDLLAVLQQVDLPNLASQSGDGDPIRGLNTKLDWTNTLSLGEQQRLAFARIITNKPRLVIMDESTSALDVNAERRLYNLLKNDQTLTYISVGHRPTLLAYHDIKLAIKDGLGIVSEIQPGSGVVVDEDLLG